MSCDVGKAMEGLENDLWRRWSDGKFGEWAELIDIEIYSRAHSPTFRHFTYVTNHSPTLPSLYLRHSSFSNPSFASLTSQALHLRHLASRPCNLKLFFNELVKNYPHYRPRWLRVDADSRVNVFAARLASPTLGRLHSQESRGTHFTGPAASHDMEWKKIPTLGRQIWYPSHLARRQDPSFSIHLTNLFEVVTVKDLILGYNIRPHRKGNSR